MNTFLENNNIPYHFIWYYLDDITNKKISIGEKNTRSIEEIKNMLNNQLKLNMTKPANHYRLDKKQEYYLTSKESNSLEKAYTVYLKHSNNIYCIDVDDENINSMNDFIAKTGLNIFRNTAWINGNNKGIHIYVKINSMIKFTTELDVFTSFNGDLIGKNNNIWEKTNKVMNGSVIESFEYNDIKTIFNNKINKEQIIPQRGSLLSNELQSLVQTGEIKKYIELGLKYKIFEKMRGRNQWYDIGILIKNELGEDGVQLFVDLSRHHPNFNENDVRALYKLFNKSVFSTNKKPLTIDILLSYYKKADSTIIKKIKKDANTTQTNEEPYNFDKNKLINFDSHYMNTFKQFYHIQKQYFEKFVCKVMRPAPMYIYVESNNKDLGKQSCIWRESELVDGFKHITTEIETEQTIKDKRFIDLWINDGMILCYNKMDFIPYNGTEQQQDDKTIYNLFNGYNPVIETKFNESKSDIILKPFFDLGIQLCGGNKDHFDYVLKYFAHTIQKPNERIPICLIFKSKQGVGKNVFLTPISSIIGKDYFITSSNPKDFFGDYAEGFYHKLLVNMNECEGKDTFDFEGKIKSFITEDSITINPKFVRPTTIQNVARLIIFTNKPNPIPIDVKSTDRRYCVFQSTEHFLNKKYGTIFWKNLIEHFNKPEFLACLYKYLNSQNIDDVDWKGDRPITDAYKEMCKLYVPIEALFFENYIDQVKPKFLDDDGKPLELTEQENKDWNETTSNTNKKVYDDYVKFCKEFGFSNEKTFQPSIQKFNSKCSELKIPHQIIKSIGHNEFRFIAKEVYDLLLKEKYINRYIDDPEIVIEDVKGDNIQFEI
jgi:hypothetical protein